MYEYTSEPSVKAGDVVAIRPRRVGEPARLGEVLEVLGEVFHRHYRVRWEDGHESILYPGNGTSIEARVRRPEPEELKLSSPTKLLVERLLPEGIEFELLPHHRTTTAAAEARSLGVLPQTVAKTIVTIDEDGSCIRAVLSAASQLSLSKLAEAVSAAGVELLAEADLIAWYPQFELGAVPPFGGPEGDRVVIDRKLAELSHVVFEGGTHALSLRMRTADLIVVASAELADIAVD